MAKLKLHKEKLNEGLGYKNGRLFGATKNLIIDKDTARKRHGHKALTRLFDESLTPLKINGIFDYAYERDGSPIKCKIVHAGTNLYQLSDDFKDPQKIPLDTGITLKDQKSKAFISNELLFIIGAGDVLIYDGTLVKSAYKSPLSYIPTTSVGITDHRHEMKRTPNEGSNLFNPRRKNTMLGSGTKKDTDKPSIFLLDEKIAYGTRVIIEAKIRTTTSDSEPDESTTSYIGINEAGEEVSRVVTLRFERDNVTEADGMFLLEPVRDENGEIIKIKIGDKIHDYMTMPFGFRIKNNNELVLSFETNPPVVGKDNIMVEYEADIDYGEIIKSAELGARTNGAKGGEVLLLSFGENEVYFSDEKRGFFYLPSTNKITLGADGEKITSLIQLWDNVFGAFKENSFFRIKLNNSSQGGFEIYSSLDTVGAYSIYSSSLCDYDCLVFNKRGIFGVSDYKSSASTVSALLCRSNDINEILSAYSEEQKREALSIFINGYFYLFIGDDIFLTSTKQRRGGALDYEYSWCRLTGIGASALAQIDGELYFGTKDGEIRTFFDGYYDLKEVKLTTDNLGLLINNEGEFSALTLDKTELDSLENSFVRIGKHKRKITRCAIYKNGEIIMEDSFFDQNGAPAIFDGDTIAAKGAHASCTTKIITTSPSQKSLKTEASLPFFENESIEIWLELESFDYTLSKEELGYSLSLGTGKVMVNDDLCEITVLWHLPIACSYETSPILLSDKKAIISRAILELPQDSLGELNVEIKTSKASYKRQIALAEAIDFGKLSFNSLSFDKDFEKRISVPLFIRGADYLKVKLSSSTKHPLTLDGIAIEYKEAYA